MAERSNTPLLPPVCIVNEDEESLQELVTLLQKSGVAEAVPLTDSRELIPLMLRQKTAAVVLEPYSENSLGTAMVSDIIRHFPETPVVVVTASSLVDTAVACMREGAFDYFIKPVDQYRFVASVRRAVESFLLRQEVHALKVYLSHTNLSHQEAFGRILTNNKEMKQIFQYVEAIAGSGESLLITGETGVGKGLLAEAVHHVSGRSGEFVSLNVAGLDDNLFSDTLFGHRKGAFSGADTHRDGLVARASGGTLFLDEIGDLKHPSQVKLLRLLQEQSYYPLGSDVPKLSSARILAATNHDLRKLIATGSFRQDLFYRLTAHRIEIPPIRERKEDIPLLLGYFIQEACRTMNKNIPDVPSQLVTLLSNFHFPGNVRQMRAMVFDAVARHPGGAVISMDSFHKYIRENAPHGQRESKENTSPETPPIIPGDIPFPTLKEGVAMLVQEAMRRANNNQGIAATLLGITRQSLNRRVLKLRHADEDD
ncbi:MAG: sigma-54-dependent Fis family transcriptional regulator [Magnetococcales bacterium]|nr:sigma-54-dependent Fis family transcriptional regulator [Magnetococcales bacterium]NGZ26396.1 sigma-54-dependent Fis family transcriptional regulator [Magnetococcales bacterium]